MIALKKNINDQPKIRNELTDILLSEKPSIGIELFRKQCRLTSLLPELANCIDFPHRDKKDLYRHLLTVADNVTNRFGVPLRFSALYHDVAKPLTRKIKDGKLSYHKHCEIGSKLVLERMLILGFSTDEAKHAATLTRKHMLNYSRDWSDKAVWRFKKKYGSYWEELFNQSIADINDSSNKKGAIKLYQELNIRIKEAVPPDTLMFRYNFEYGEDQKQSGWQIKREATSPNLPSILYQETSEGIKMKLAHYNQEWLTFKDNNINIDAKVSYEGKSFSSKEEFDNFCQSNFPGAEVIQVNPDKKTHKAFSERLIDHAIQAYIVDQNLGFDRITKKNSKEKDYR